MSYFSAYSAAESTAAALDDHLGHKFIYGLPKQPTITHFFACSSECDIKICAWSSLKLLAPIGRGSSMEVWRGTMNGRPVAIKCLRDSEIPQSNASVDASNRRIGLQLKAAIFEIQCMSLPEIRQSPNVVDLLAVSWTEKGPEWQRILRPALVMELAAEETPTLEQLIPHLESRRLDIKAQLLDDIIKGLCDLQCSNIIHRDLKPENVLIFHDSSRLSGYIAKLSDFGYSHVDLYSLMRPGGTQYWNAPECLDGSLPEPAHNPGKSDIYSFGLLATYLITGQKPFGSDASEYWPEKESEVNNMKLEDRVSAHVRDSIRQTVRVKPAFDTEFDLDNDHTLYKMVEQNRPILKKWVKGLNSRLAEEDHPLEIYNRETCSWEDATGWLPVGFVCFLSTTVRQHCGYRPNLRQMVNVLGFVRPNVHLILDTSTPTLCETGSASRGIRKEKASMLSQVPQSMQAQLFQHMRSVAEYEQGDGLVQLAIADCYEVGMGVEQNAKEAFQWLLKAALVCKITGRRVMLMRQVMWRHLGATVFVGDLEEDLERKILVECITYMDLPQGLDEEEDDTQRRRGRSKLFNLLSTSDAISMETLRRGFWCSSRFPIGGFGVDALAGESVESGCVSTRQIPPPGLELVANLESIKTLGESQTSTLSTLTRFEIFSLAHVAIYYQSFTALSHIIRFQPTIIEQRDSYDRNLLQHALLRSDRAAVSILTKLGGDIVSLYEHQFIRDICTYTDEINLAYLAELVAFLAQQHDSLLHNPRFDLNRAVVLASYLPTTSVEYNKAWPPLYHAIAARNIRMVDTLLSMEFTPPLPLEAHVVGGFTAVWLAVIISCPLITGAVVVAGADAEHIVRVGDCAMKPLHYVCAEGDNENEVVQQGDTICQAADEYADRVAVAASRFNGRDKQVRLDASERETVRNELCTVLVRYGKANINSRDSHGLTPLMWCCKRGFLSTAKHMVGVCEKIANEAKPTGRGKTSPNLMDFTRVDNHGRTALDHAELAGNSEMSDWCLEIGFKSLLVGAT